MERQKRWQLILIVAVLCITLYNILPTVFYYTKPLKQPIGQERAFDVAGGIVARVDNMEEDSVKWLESFSDLLHVRPTKIEVRAAEPRLIDVVFANSGEAQRFRAFLPRAGTMIPFVPAQLQLGQSAIEDLNVVVTVERRIGVRLDAKDIPQLFQFSERFDAQGQPSELYRELVNDRVAYLAAALGGPSSQARQVQSVASGELNDAQQEIALNLAQDIVEAKKVLAKAQAPIFKRIAATYSQATDTSEESASKALIAQFKTLATKITAQKQAIKGTDGARLEPQARERIALLDQQLGVLSEATTVLQANTESFDKGAKPLTVSKVRKELADQVGYDATTKQQTINLHGRNPYVKSLMIDWVGAEVVINLYDDVQKILSSSPSSEDEAYLKDRINQFLIGEIATVSQDTDENLVPKGDGYAVALSTLNDSKSFLAFKLNNLAEREVDQLQGLLEGTWVPKQGDLTRDVYPVRTYSKYLTETPQDQRLGLVIYAPAMDSKNIPEGFETDGVYVIARGLQDIIQKYREIPSAETGKDLAKDFNALVKLMEQHGFMHYPGNSWGVAKEFSHDYIFRLPNFYDNLLKSTREDFTVKGSRHYAVLDFTDVEQRILTLNRIEDKMHEDLLKWRDEYQAAQVDLNPVNRYYVPKPTSNVYWDNLLLSTRKYFRGDDSKVLKWGLDLSGGKTVRIGLTDQNGKLVTDPEDLKQAMNELYVRINKMGVAERSIRLEGSNVVLDFPGSQGLSASELVKASTMYFHIINEKFGPPPRRAADMTENREVTTAANQFLQQVWNEAVVTNRKDMDGINAIAWRHLGGNADVMRPRSEHARTLWDNGLRLANPAEKQVSGALNDALSSVAMYKGEDFSEWGGNTHPLVFIFHNYALEGSSLTNIAAGYDPSEGNMLSFEVKSSYEGNRSGDPRDDFYAWTSQFSKEQVAGTQRETYTGGEGWRMAVVLNDRVISAPTLQAALRDRARITGRFSQREVNQLAADLKAGSLSFTPKILAEENISPDLGLEERSKGVRASLIAIVAVVIAMVGYYRFAGIVASVAVILNLFIMWGVLQNIGAALTLSGIAGLVLTIGMAVDANVLVFERFREEFLKSGRLASAMQAGYRKAFSAIIDSNITTILAALILTQFDSGPVKGFATIIIIGIVSSMFTGLFMTRFFFAGWVQNPNHKELKMSHWIHDTKVNFLGYAKPALMIVAVLSAISIYSLWAQKSTILGMDFTGGYALTAELQEQPNLTESYRLAVKKALEKHGIASKDVQVKQLSRPTQLKIQLGMGVEESGRPFYGLPLELPDAPYDYAYQQNPRIDWVVKALADEGLQIRKADLDHLESQWTVMSGQFSETMRNNALWALGLALLAILLYITFRFEFKYAISAVIGLAIDVVVSLGVLSLFHLMGFSVQLDLEIVGAVMMIIGYSLNDTIIVFDRIREDVKVLRKLEFRDMVNHALNITLSRTLMTSGTTLLVLLCLVLFGGSALFGFSLVMAIGVIVGTLGSLFVCAPIMLYFHEREERNEEARLKLRKA
ncbi:MAG: protein translocase subunit SecD [Chlamydiales bacterium]|nr:protein translocase subunit SecD [Chlamydiales bacterium]